MTPLTVADKDFRSRQVFRLYSNTITPIVCALYNMILFDEHFIHCGRRVCVPTHNNNIILYYILIYNATRVGGSDPTSGKLCRRTSHKVCRTTDGSRRNSIFVQYNTIYTQTHATIPFSRINTTIIIYNIYGAVWRETILSATCYICQKTRFCIYYTHPAALPPFYHRTFSGTF